MFVGGCGVLVGGTGVLVACGWLVDAGVLVGRGVDVGLGPEPPPLELWVVGVGVAIESGVGVGVDATIGVSVEVDFSVGMRAGSCVPDPSSPGVPRAPRVASMAAVAGAPAGSVTPGSSVPLAGTAGVGSSPPVEPLITTTSPTIAANMNSKTTAPMISHAAPRPPFFSAGAG